MLTVKLSNSNGIYKDTNTNNSEKGLFTVVSVSVQKAQPEKQQQKLKQLESKTLYDCFSFPHAQANMQN